MSWRKRNAELCRSCSAKYRNQKNEAKNHFQNTKRTFSEIDISNLTEAANQVLGEITEIEE